MNRLPAIFLLAGCVLAATLLGGCGVNLSQANDDLRLENLRLKQSWERQRDELRDREATIRRLEEQLDQRVPRVATLPKARLAELFTVGRVEIRSATDAWDFNDDGLQDGFRVYFRTLTEHGDVLPATGTLTVEAFDLENKQHPLVAQATFTPDQLKSQWYGGLGLDQFAVNVPWNQPPGHIGITFRLSFIDALTGRVFEDQKLIKVHLATPLSADSGPQKPAASQGAATRPEAAGASHP